MTNSATSMDRISQLPTEILHQILSLLPTKTAARTAVLSKPWLKACYTNSSLCFDESDFGEEGQNNGRFVDYHGEFSKLVDNTLVRYRRENIPISAFKLHISFSDQTDCNGLVDKWLDIVAEKRASQVKLLVKSRSGISSKRYSLLADTIFAMESLQQLELNHCRILKQKALLSEDKIKCSNLKNLTLCYVTVTESALDSLISSCSKLLMISFQHFMGFGCIRVSKNLPNLLSLSILCCPIKEVRIGDAPKLLSFEYVNNGDSEFYLSRHNLDICLRTIEIGTCQNLRRVEFVNAEIDDTVLFKLIPKLHFIKELILHYCKYLKKIKIASSTLEVCIIECCKYLVQATFDVPNLLSLVVKPMQNFDKRTRLPSLSFASASSQCRISIKYGDLPSDVEHIIDLRRYLVELNDKVVDLTLGSVYKGLRAARGIDHLPAPEVENLILLTNCDWSDTTYSSYLNDIFWICSPKNLTVHCGKKFRKFLRQKLLKKCRWRPFKYSWKEYFINAQIDCMKWTGDDWMTLDWKMLAANPRMIDEIRRIRFKQTQGKEIKKESYILRCILR